ncbi:MAG: FixH family protein [Alphaproteobacteria bacterium]
MERDAPLALALSAEGAGVYSTTVGGLRPGQWDLTVDGARDDGRIRLRQRLVLR